MKLLVLLLVVTTFVQNDADTLDFAELDIEILTPVKIKRPMRPSGRIMFGTEVADNDRAEFSHQVKVNSKDAISTALCGGSYIHPLYVLTAAHCLSNIKWNNELKINETFTALSSDMYFGLLNTDDITNRAGNFVHRRSMPNMFIIHPAWSLAFLQKDDLALIRLTEPVNLVQDRIALIPLPTRAICDLNLLDKTATISGWGHTEFGVRSNQLKSAQVVIIAASNCAKYYGRYYADVKTCIYGNNKEKACRGDSGGPMTYKDTNFQKFLIGLSSNGASNCKDDKPSVYSNVCKYVDWINNEIAKAPQQPAVRVPQQLPTAPPRPNNQFNNPNNFNWQPSNGGGASTRPNGYQQPNNQIYGKPSYGGDAAYAYVKGG